MPAETRAALAPAFVDVLATRFGAALSLNESVRVQHGRGESPYRAQPPDAVVFAESVQDAIDLVALCAAAGVPVIAHGAGSSLEGHLLAVRGGVALDLARMNRIVSIDVDDLSATVEAGVTREQLNDALRHTGLFFPIDPGAHASLGGMAATRASGTNAVRYGTMRENVLALTAVTADGSLVHTGCRARKSAAGYDLTRLFVGSEGTLGVITELTVRLYPQPEASAVAVAHFPTPDAAIRTVIEAIQAGIPLARCEYLCEDSIAAVNAHSKLALAARPTLFFEFHGSTAGVAEQSAAVQALAAAHGAGDFRWAGEPEARSRLWQARHAAYHACRLTRADAAVIATDTCVPISKLADSIEGARAILAGAPFPTMIFGHVGDGNFHALLIVNLDDAAELAAAERLNADIVALAQRMGGTCSGEHGIGLHKIDFLPQETGPGALELMRRIKRALDPAGILNPGKILRPDAAGTAR